MHHGIVTTPPLIPGLLRAISAEALGTRLVVFRFGLSQGLRQRRQPRSPGNEDALGQAVDLRRNSDAEAWSHSICIPP